VAEFAGEVGATCEDGNGKANHTDTEGTENGDVDGHGLDARVASWYSLPNNRTDTVSGRRRQVAIGSRCKSGAAPQL